MQDKGQKFSGVGNPANPVKPRTLRPGGTKDQDEAVQLDPINQPGDPKELLGPRQSDSASGYAGNRKVGTGDKPFNWPADDTKNTTTPILDNPGDEWGREAPALARRVSWPSYATDPGQPGPLDTTDTNPKRPDFGAPSHDSYDIIGEGENEVGLEGARGILPIPGKKNQWA